MSNDKNELNQSSETPQDANASELAKAISTENATVQENLNYANKEEKEDLHQASERMESAVSADSEANSLDSIENNVEKAPVVESSETISTSVTQSAEIQTESTSANEEHDEDGDDKDEDDDENESSEESAFNSDFSRMNKSQLLEAAHQTQNLTPREALKALREIRSLILDMVASEQRLALEEYLEAGNEAEGFEFNDEGIRDKIKDIYSLARDARKEEKDRIEREKAKNLALKKEILEKLSKITESDETEQSLNEVKELQQEWKKIRLVPADNVKELWESYNFYLDKFYDNHSINIELKELDRKKNLETKIELCKKVDELSQENSLKRSFILLNKYQEEFRNTGPVPREYNKEIWERFQQACDKLYEQKKVLFDELEEKRKKNLELKQLLVEKATLTVSATPTKQKEWRDKSTELDALMTEWKKIGPAPKSDNDAVWKAFRASFNTFYENKSTFFKELNNVRKANLIVKEDICKRAEAVKDSEDFNFATNELIALQKEWKDVGPVPEKVSNAIWKRFRGACDHFFERKNQQFASKREEETNNLKTKESLIEKMNVLFAGNESGNILLDSLKSVQREWNQVGFVPIKSKRDLDTRFQKISDQIFEKFKIDRQSMKSGQATEHYKQLAELPSGQRRLDDEEQKIKKKITFLTGEIQTLENNMEFFGRSAGAQKLKREIEEKIQKSQEQIDRLKAELKAIKKVTNPPKEKLPEVENTEANSGTSE